MTGLEQTIGEDWFVKQVTLSTTAASLEDLLALTLPSSQVDDVKEVILREGSDDILYAHSSSASNFMTLTAGESRSLPVRGALQKVFLKSSTGTPTVMVEVYF